MNIFDEMNAAQASGNSQYADYLGDIIRIGGQQGIMSQLGGPAPVANKTVGGTDYIGKALNTLDAGFWAAITAPFGGGWQTGKDINATTTGAAGGVVSAAKLISDPARLGTIFMGGVLITAGIFAMTRGTS